MPRSLLDDDYEQDFQDKDCGVIGMERTIGVIPPTDAESAVTSQWHSFTKSISNFERERYILMSLSSMICSCYLNYPYLQWWYRQ